MTQKYAYLFSEGNADMRNLLGGKGANLAEMTALGMPVPQGFTISTEACTRYYDDGRKIGEDIDGDRSTPLWPRREEINGKKFGDSQNPLLVSVRSGARASMPGMMDTILNLGLNDDAGRGVMAKQTDNPRFAYDSYRRFIQMFSDVVMEHCQEASLKSIIDDVKDAKGVKLDTELDADDLKEARRAVQGAITRRKWAKTSRSDPKEQLMEAVKAVFRSWDNPRANRLPPHERYPRQLGHRRQRAGHGIRQHGRRFRHRRCLHPRPCHRRKEALWRISDERPGRRRGCRYPHAPAHRPAGRGHARGV